MGEGLVFQRIGKVRSCFKQKFGIPRQPGLAPGTTAILDIFPPYGAPECFRGIEQYTHLWVFFHFHATADQGWRSTVRPPRLGGDIRIGVFATRSNFRPNPIGLSVVRFTGITYRQGHALLEVSNHDLLDGTPILDIKPYIAYADAHPDAQSFAPPVSTLNVEILPEVLAAVEGYPQLDPEAFEPLVRSLVSTDPRPAYLAGQPDEGIYAIPIGDVEFCFRMISPDTAQVYALRPFRGVPKKEVGL